jgi:unsaturated rhamnogalacturonyl hydrolase
VLDDPVDMTIYLPAVQTTDRLITSVATRTMGMGDRMLAWDWEAGVGLVGLMYASASTDDPAILDYVDEWMSQRVAEGASFVGGSRGVPDCQSGDWLSPTAWHPNNATPAWAALLLFDLRPEPELLREIELAAHFLRYDACRAEGAIAHVPGQLWDDTLIVSVPVLGKYGAMIDDPEWVSFAADQWLAHALRLQNRDTGLWYHGWRSEPGDNMSGAYWARGNGWVALATTELLAQLPESDPRREEIRLRFEQQMEALAALQDPSSGLWHTVVTRPEFYLETSGSAAIAAAMYRAVGAGWIGPEYDLVADRALQGANRRVDRDGSVTGVSAGTGVAPTIEDYNSIGTDRPQPYGQGLFLILSAAAESG